MRHQRQGWRRLVALPVALLGALVIAPSVGAAGPNTVGNTVLDVTDCQATIAISWAAQPGRLKTYSVELSVNGGPAATIVSGAALGRSDSIVLGPIAFGTSTDSNQFLAVTRVYDGKGVEQDSWPSRPVPAPCI
ncbi:MAG TPA: hypothetical protein VKC59_03990 [Candidatus Limnocylindrales bacterium]|nr:hypothetical protein [Candidatus Limnocylindrales bacterium]